MTAPRRCSFETNTAGKEVGNGLKSCQGGMKSRTVVLPVRQPAHLQQPRNPLRRRELQAIKQRVRRTRVSAAWVAIIVSLVVLVLLLILILENLRDGTVTYLGPSRGMWCCYCGDRGALIVAVVGVTRLTLCGGMLAVGGARTPTTAASWTADERMFHRPGASRA